MQTDTRTLQAVWDAAESLSGLLHRQDGLDQALRLVLEDLLIKAGPAAEGPVLALLDAQSACRAEVEAQCGQLRRAARTN